MIASVAGVLEFRGADHVVVEVSGIGLKVFTSASTLASLSDCGDTVKLLTMLYVRQEQLALYGFGTREELHLFELLLGVSGIGPKAALAVLSGASRETIQVAVATGSAAVLEKVPGIGKKTAARIVLELKGKLDGQSPLSPVALGIDGEAVEALTQLGYSVTEAHSALTNTGSPGSSLEERIANALRFLATRVTR